MKQHIALKQMEAMKQNVKGMRLAAEQWDNDFQTLISIILSARTRDEVTIEVCKKLFGKFPTANKLSKASLQEIETLIKPINFYRNKSKNILNCAKVIVSEFNSKIPKSIEELVKLPGVGRKTANVFLTEMGGLGIGVDTHVSYISQKLGWTKNKDAHKIEQDLKKLFPQKYWNNVNRTLVRFGKTHTSRKKKDELLNEIKKLK